MKGCADIEKCVNNHFSILKEYLDERFGLLGDEIQNQANARLSSTLSLEQRMERLETIVTCGPYLSPSVDEVLDGLLAKCQKREPEIELSPIKEAHIADNNFDEGCISDRTSKGLLDEEDAINPKTLKFAPCQTFDIYDQPVNVGIQTDTHKQPRKSRVNGRATQTDDLARARNAVPELAEISAQTEVMVNDFISQFNGIGVDDAFRPLLSVSDVRDMVAMSESLELEPLIEPIVGDVVQFVNDVATDDSTVQISIAKGCRGKIIKIDGDGDLEFFMPQLLKGCYLSFPKWFAMRWCFHDKVKHMMRCRMPAEYFESMK